jgi:hypothetical protein
MAQQPPDIGSLEQLEQLAPAEFCAWLKANDVDVSPAALGALSVSGLVRFALAKCTWVVLLDSMVVSIPLGVMQKIHDLLSRRFVGKVKLVSFDQHVRQRSHIIRNFVLVLWQRPQRLSWLCKAI